MTTVNLDLDLDSIPEFDVEDFDKAVLAHGARVLWSRALECPCRLNGQTQNPDPSCPVCESDGYFYVYPEGAMRPVQYDCEPAFVDSEDAAATQVIVQSVTKDPQIFEKLGEWVFGTMRVTPFSFARVDFRDRLQLVDTVTSHRQVMYTPEDKVLRFGRTDAEKFLRYKAIGVREAYTIRNNAKVDLFDSTTVNADGSITIGDPAVKPKTLVTVSYDYHPILIVMDHAFAWRDALIRDGNKNPIGQNAKMPHHSMARLDFLVSTKVKTPA